MLAVAAVGVALGWIAGAGAFALLLAGLCLFIAYCRRRAAQTKAWATRPDARIRERFRYELLRCAAFYFVPVAAALAFYVVLLIYIAWLADDVSLGWLMSMERTFHDVSRTFKDNFVLSPIEVFVVLVCLYLLSCALLARRGAAPGRARLVAALQRGVDAYGRHTARIATCLATLASLTLFGSQLGAPASDLRLRIKDTQDRYAQVARRTEADITQRVAVQLYAKTRDALPRSYREALHLPARLHSSVRSARSEASNARSRWHEQVAAVDRVMHRDTVRSRALRHVRSDLVVGAAGRRSPPDDVTQKRVQAASSVPIGAASEPEIELMRIGRKKIVLHVEKLVSSRIVEVTRPLVHAVPILKPVLQAFVASADATVQARIERAYDRVMSAQLSDGAVPEAKIEREAEAVVAATGVTRPVDSVSRQAMRPANRLTHEVASLQTGRARLAERVAQARAEARRRAAERAEAARRRREQPRQGSLAGRLCIPGASVPRGYICVPGRRRR